MTAHAAERLTERIGITLPEAEEVLDSLTPQARSMSRLRWDSYSRLQPDLPSSPRCRFLTKIQGHKVHLVWDIQDEVFVTAFLCEDPAPYLSPPPF